MSAFFGSAANLASSSSQSPASAASPAPGTVIYQNITASGDARMHLGNLTINQYTKEDEGTAILKWLSTIKYETTHNTAVSNRTSDTGLWLLQDAKYLNWRNDAAAEGYLWCHGGPGTGKTVLTSAVVEDLVKNTDESFGIAYYYHQHLVAKSEKPTLESTVSVFLKQLMIKKGSIPQPIMILYEKCGRGNGRPSENMLVETLVETCKEFKRVFFVLDAFDECDQPYREKLFSGLNGLDQSITRFFLTSRPHLLDMEEKFGKYPQIEIGAAQSDLKLYILQRIREESKLKSLMDDSGQLETRIITTVSEKANNIFLLARLQMDEICDCRNSKTISDALETMPTDLDNAFHNTITRISKQKSRYDQETARKVLLWLSYAQRPLSVEEVLHFLAVQVDKTSFDAEYKTQEGILIDVCFGLVVVDTESSIIGLVHHSLREHFQQVQVDYFRSEENTIVQTCLTVLLYDEFAAGYRDKAALDARLKAFPMYNYAASYWGMHARGKGEVACEDKILKLLKDNTKLESATQVMHVPTSEGYLSINDRRRTPKNFSGIHVVCYFGLSHILTLLLKEDVNPDLKEGNDRTPLSWASERGHLEVVEVLISANVNVNSAVGDSLPLVPPEQRKPPMEATTQGRLQIIWFRFVTGAIIPTNLHDRWTALHWAAAGGYLDITKLLLKSGCVIGAADSWNRNSLHWAAQRGHSEVAKFLIDNGADVNAQDWEGQTPLLSAAEEGQVKIVKLLLDNGADRKAFQKPEKTALDIVIASASYRMKEDTQIQLIKLLATPEELPKALERQLLGRHPFRNRALRTALTGNRTLQRTPLVPKKVVAPPEPKVDPEKVKLNEKLLQAVEDGDTTAVQTVLEEGANIEYNEEKESGKKISQPRYRPLGIAAKKGDKEMLNLLLQKGANINAILHFSTALMLASGQGNQEVVQLLINAGADVNIEGAHNALLFATRGGHEHIVRLLLDNGALVTYEKKEDSYLDQYGPLHAASENGYEKIARIFIEAGAKVNEEDCLWGTPVQIASEKGYEQIVRLLLDNGADPNLGLSFHESALIRATSSGHEIIVRWLLEAGADIKATSKDGTALFKASENGHEQIVRLLLDKGAEIIVETTLQSSAVGVAAEEGHENIVQLLIEHGADIGVEGLNNWGTPLDMAVRSGRDKVVTLLIEKGADVNRVSEGTNPLIRAAGGRFENTLLLLIGKGAEVNPKGLSQTPLTKAAEMGILKNIRLLIQKGADLEAKNDKGQTARQVAIQKSKDSAPHEKASRLAIKQYFETTELLRAVLAGNETKVKAILEDGGSPHARTLAGVTAIRKAIDKGCAGIVDLLLEHGADDKVTYKYGDTMLHIAAQNGKTEVVQVLLKHKANIEAKNENEKTPLYVAAEEGHQAVVKVLLENGANIEADNNGSKTLLIAAENSLPVTELLLDSGANINSADDSGDTALHSAVSAEKKSIVELLLNRGANLEAENEKGATALYVAASGYSKAITQLLVDRGANVLVKSKKGNTVLHETADNDSTEISKIFLTRGVDFRAKNDLGETALHIAAIRGNTIQVKLLLESGADATTEEFDEKSTLYMACANGEVAVVKLLLEHGAKSGSFNADELVTTAQLYNAIENSRTDLVRSLIEKGANIGLKNMYGESALHRAIEAENATVARLLVEARAEIMSRDQYLRTPLHVAAGSGQTEVVRLLLGKGAELDAKDDDNITPLWKACCTGNKKTVELLLDKGANSTFKNGHGQTLLHEAAGSGETAICQLLLERGADLEAKDDDGERPVHRAASGYEKACLALLLQKGANVNVKTNDGNTPLHCAADDEEVMMINLLLEKGAIASAKNEKGLTALDLARKNEYPKVISLLSGKK